MPTLASAVRGMHEPALSRNSHPAAGWRASTHRQRIDREGQHDHRHAPARGTAVSTLPCTWSTSTTSGQHATVRMRESTPSDPGPKDHGTQRMWVVHTVVVPYSTIFTDYLRVVPWVLGWGEYLWTAAVKRGRGVPLPLPQRQPETGSDYRRTQLLFPPIRGYKA